MYMSTYGIPAERAFLTLLIAFVSKAPNDDQARGLAKLIPLFFQH